MHPMFKELFIQTYADDLPAEEDRRRRARRSRRARSAVVIRPRGPASAAPAAAVTGARLPCRRSPHMA